MELLEDRIDRAERLVRSLKKQTAPTVPQYDLQGGTPGTVGLYRANTGAGFNNLMIPIIEPDTTYTFELHTIISSKIYEIYLNGNLVDNGVSSSTIFNGQEFLNWSFGGGGTTPGAIDPTTYYYAWDFRVGTTRGATDVFSDNLSSLPTVPPWGHATFETVSGLDSWEVVSLGGVGNVLKINMLGDNHSAFGVGTGQLGFTDEEWQYFNLRFPATFINNVVSNPFYNLHGIQVTFGLLSEGQLSAFVN